MGPSQHQARSETINCLAALHSRTLVPDSQMRLFCEIVQFQAIRNENCHDQQARAKCHIRIQPLLKDLRFPLVKPDTLTSLILPKQSTYTKLCDLHQPLNADFVHQWFKILALEVGAHLEPLRASGGSELGNFIRLHCVNPLTRLHKMWETPERIEKAFGRFVDDDFTKDANLIDVRPQRDGCEACILARIGGHPQTVMALRAVVKSRLTPESQERHRSRLRLLRLTENWIEQWRKSDMDGNRDFASHWEKYLHENDQLSEEIWENRKNLKIQRQRIRRTLRYSKPTYFDPNKYEEVMIALDEKNDDESIFDAENDIINVYAALRSTQRTSQFFSMLERKVNQGRVPEVPDHQTRTHDLPDNFASVKLDSTPKRSQSTLNCDPYTLQILCSADLSSNDEKITIYATSAPYVDPAYCESRYSIDTTRNNDRVVRNTTGSSNHTSNLSHRTSERPQRTSIISTLSGDSWYNNRASPDRNESSRSTVSHKSLPQRAASVSRSTTSQSGRSTKAKSRPVQRSNTVMSRISEELHLSNATPTSKKALSFARRDTSDMSSSSRSLLSSSSMSTDNRDDVKSEQQDSRSSWTTASIPESSRSFQSSKVLPGSRASSRSTIHMLEDSSSYRSRHEL